MTRSRPCSSPSFTSLAGRFGREGGREGEGGRGREREGGRVEGEGGRGRN